MSKPKYSDQIAKEGFESYYRAHSIRETQERFCLSEGQVLALAKYYDIKKTPEEVKRTKRESTVRRCQALYGTSNGGCSELALSKIKKTVKERYGMDSYFKTDEFKQKAKQTKIERYGRADVGQFGTQEHKAAMIEKYGVEEAMQSPELRKRLDKVMLEKYGVNRYAKTLDFHKKARKLYKVDSGETFDSSWELALWIYAKDHGESITRCPTKFEYSFEGKKHWYVPDFLYNNKLVEIKGDNWVNKHDEFTHGDGKTK